MSKCLYIPNDFLNWFLSRLLIVGRYQTRISNHCMYQMENTTGQNRLWYLNYTITYLSRIQEYIGSCSLSNIKQTINLLDRLKTWLTYMLFSTHTHTENFIVSNKFETFKKAEKQIMADEFIKFFVFLNIKSVA